MHTETVKLPSRAVITIRKMSLNDQSNLASVMRSQRAKQDQVLVDMVARCALGFEDTGPYPWAEESNKIIWKDMLQGDFLAALIALRKFSYREGKEYEVDLKCPDRSCNNRFQWKVDLDDDLYYQELPEESFEKIKNGEPFITEVDGKKVTFDLSYVRDNDMMEKLAKRFPGRDMAIMFRSRIKSVETVDPKDLMNWLDGEGKGPYEGLLADDAEDMRATFQKVDCGIDTEVEAECPRFSCGNVFTFDLPFAGMLTPGRGAMRKKKLRRDGADSSED